jgi:hypothetical protein
MARPVRIFSMARIDETGGNEVSYLLLLLAILACGLDAIPRFDYVRFETYRSRPPVQFEEEAARIAEHAAVVIAAP